MAVIDIGAAAINRAGSIDIWALTAVEASNPADGTGNIDTVEAWWNYKLDPSDAYVGTFSAVGNVLTCRDSQSIGDVITGSKQTYTGLTISVVTGDYIGTKDKAGSNELYIERASSGGTGNWYYAGEVIDPSDSATFGYSNTYIMSLYGTGVTAGGGGWANIKNMRMGTGSITATDLASIWFGTTEVAVADIAELPVGVAV